MQLPVTNSEVAWYAFGSRPGDRTGTTVMAAHGDTRAWGLGPFARLRQLHRGATIAVTDADSHTRHYVVTAVDDVQKSKIVLDQLFRRDGAARAQSPYLRWAVPPANRISGQHRRDGHTGLSSPRRGH